MAALRSSLFAQPFTRLGLYFAQLYSAKLVIESAASNSLGLQMTRAVHESVWNPFSSDLAELGLA